jgi:hypothetical protein
VDKKRIPRVNDLAEITNLAAEVSDWFRELKTRFNPPSRSGCGMIAFYILTLGPRPQHQQNATIKHAKALLRHLKDEEENVIRHIDQMLSGEPVVYWLNKKQELRAALGKAQAAIRDLVPVLSPPSDPDRDPIRHLAAIVREAFEETNAGRSPKSNKPEGVICRFLVGAVARGGQPLSPETISAILKGKRRAVPGRDKKRS